MTLDINIHQAQTNILRELLFHPQAGFADLQRPTGLTSNHFNFHIARLVELELVEKLVRGQYRLSARGKEYANRLDTDNNTVERQPKAAVILALRRERNDTVEYVFQERLKNPYFGYWGLPTGKIRWGETVVETAAREASEETGLRGNFEVKGVYHELVHQQDTQELLEDKMFFVVTGTDIAGELALSFEGGHNEWMTFDQFIVKSKKFDSYHAQIEILAGGRWMIERSTAYHKDEF